MEFLPVCKIRQLAKFFIFFKPLEVTNWANYTVLRNFNFHLLKKQYYNENFPRFFA